MKGADAVGKVFDIRRRSRRTGSGSGFRDALRSRWRSVREFFQRHPRIFYRALLAIPVLWVLFDFVTFSFGTLPVVPEAVQVQGLRRVSADQVRTEIFRKLRLQNADNLIEANLMDLSDHLLKQVPAIRSATITQNIGRGIMTVVVAERTGVAVIQKSPVSLEVDAEGMLYLSEPGKSGALPQVTGLAGSFLASGRNLFEHPAGAGLLRILSSLPPGFGHKLKSVRVIRSDYLELLLAGDILVKADPANFPHKAGALQTIVRNLDRDVAYIDMRFQQDVIAYRAERPQGRGSKKGR